MVCGLKSNVMNQLTIFDILNNTQSKSAIALPVENSHYKSTSSPVTVFNVNEHEECLKKFVEKGTTVPSYSEYCSMENGQMTVWWTSDENIENINPLNWNYNIINGVLYEKVMTNGMDYIRKNY